MKVRTFFSNAGSWLKEFFQNIGDLLISVLLIFLAVVLIAIAFLPAVIWKLIFSVKKEKRKARGILSGTTHFFTGIAIALDQVGNVAFGSFFNWLFLTNDQEYPFGKTHETVSEVLGWNEALGNLNRKGLLLVSFLNIIESAHCEKSMNSGWYKAKYKVDYYKELQEKLQTKKNTKAFLAKY